MHPTPYLAWFLIIIYSIMATALWQHVMPHCHVTTSRHRIVSLVLCYCQCFPGEVTKWPFLILRYVMDTKWHSWCFVFGLQVVTSEKNWTRTMVLQTYILVQFFSEMNPSHHLIQYETPVMPFAIWIKEFPAVSIKYLRIPLILG